MSGTPSVDQVAVAAAVHRPTHRACVGNLGVCQRGPVRPSNVLPGRIGVRVPYSNVAICIWMPLGLWIAAGVYVF